MKIIRNELTNPLNIRTQKDYPVKGVEFIDISPLLMQKETLAEIIQKMVAEVQSKKVDYIISPEARGFLLGTAVAEKLRCGFVPVRKKGKLPPTTIEKQFTYEKEYGKDVLELPKLVHETYQEKNFYMIDDIYATGNTARAIKQAIESLGGNVIRYRSNYEYYRIKQ